jgi:hypothetical protein
MSGQANAKWLQLVSTSFPFQFRWLYKYIHPHQIHAPRKFSLLGCFTPRRQECQALRLGLLFPSFKKDPASLRLWCVEAHKYLCPPSGESRNPRVEASQTEKHKQQRGSDCLVLRSGSRGRRRNITSHSAQGRTGCLMSVVTKRLLS